MEKSIGVCIGEPSTREVEFIASCPVKLGDFVEMVYEGYRVLGFVRSVKRLSKALSGDLEPEEIRRIREISSSSSLFKGVVTILGDVEKDMFVPRIPPEPGTEIFEASTETLEKVFGRRDGGIFLGHLLTRPEVPVYVDVNSIISRHLAVLAVTGAGKSNTVSVILEGILEKGGVALVFDMHGEYLNFGFESSEAPPVRRIDLVLNPIRLSYHEFRIFANVDDSAFIQDRYLRRAFKRVVGEIQNGETPATSFWGRLLGELEKEKEEAPKEDMRSIVGVIGKVEDMKEFYAELFDPLQTPIVDQIEYGKVNVVDLSHVDEKIADIVVSHVLKNVLESRKNYIRGLSSGLPFPLLIVLEEAHILASSSIPTRSRYWISRIAREGRKFGLGLCLVTQRPKSLDANALSQANNMIILRLIEPGDQRHVQQASEALSSDLVEQLPSLNVGEALVMGTMLPVPALVKIRKARAKRSGGDVKALEEWERFSKEKEKANKELADFLSLEDEEF